MYDIVQGQQTSYIAGNIVESESRRLVSELGDGDGADVAKCLCQNGNRSYSRMTHLHTPESRSGAVMAARRHPTLPICRSRAFEPIAAARSGSLIEARCPSHRVSYI
ncbi:hypothetical protein IG631_08142 [Alternaria alternata]|nr:hypothetical protein IG631_08142 [Alternaria alternata]